MKADASSLAKDAGEERPIFGCISGRSAVALPSKYCVTCLMLGLFAGKEQEQSRPSFKTNSISLARKSPSNFGSLASRIAHTFQHSKTQSTSSSGPCGFVGILPQATSSINIPKANTSVLVVAVPVLLSSRARYPTVPTT